MLSFQNYLKTIDEGGLSRVHGHLERGKAVGIVSADRGDKSGKENKRRSKSLMRRLRSKGYGPKKISGEYIEDDDGKPRKVKERSFVVTSDDHARLHKDIKQVGREYNQDSVLTVSKKRGSSLHGTGKSGWIKKGEVKRMGSSNIRSGKKVEKSAFKSRIKSKPFLFGDDDE